MTAYWLSWYHRQDYPSFELAWPWWVTGQRLSDGADTICAAIRADSESDALMAVRAAYDTDPGVLQVRFIEERPDGWTPYGDRFSKASWMPEWESTRA